MKVGSVCLSERGQVPAGISQGTKLGPWLFLLMINDLDIPDMSMWKYVDDTTSVEITCCGEVSHAQSELTNAHIEEVIKKANKKVFFFLSYSVEPIFHQRIL